MAFQASEIPRLMPNGQLALWSGSQEYNNCGIDRVERQNPYTFDELREVLENEIIKDVWVQKAIAQALEDANIE